jgi:hypothetical protein
MAAVLPKNQAAIAGRGRCAYLFAATKTAQGHNNGG